MHILNIARRPRKPRPRKPRPVYLRVARPEMIEATFERHRAVGRYATIVTMFCRRCGEARWLAGPWVDVDFRCACGCSASVLIAGVGLGDTWRDDDSLVHAVLVDPSFATITGCGREATEGELASGVLSRAPVTCFECMRVMRAS